MLLEAAHAWTASRSTAELAFRVVERFRPSLRALSMEPPRAPRASWHGVAEVVGICSAVDAKFNGFVGLCANNIVLEESDCPASSHANAWSRRYFPSVASLLPQ
jgi:hypothetical protein